MRACGGCRVCCHLYGVGALEKKPLAQCIHECDHGCAAWQTPIQPKECQDFLCPYMLGDAIYRPDTFSSLMREMESTIANTIPWIPEALPLEAVRGMIRSSRSMLMALVVADGAWKVDALLLHQRANGLLSGTVESRHQWRQLLTEHGIETPPGLE